MANNRKTDRVRFEHKHPVNVMGVDGTWRRQCTLLDVSSTGARLDVDGSTEVLRAQEFFLVLASFGLAFRRCELIWVNGSQVGVQFIQRGKNKKTAIAQKKQPAPSP